jgi:hypothetical protein
MGLRQTDFSIALRALGGRASRETVSHWENLDAHGLPRARVARVNAAAIAALVRHRLGLPATEELFYEPKETAWDAALRRQSQLEADLETLEKLIEELRVEVDTTTTAAATPQHEPLLNTRDVADMLNVSEETARQWFEAGELPGFELPSGESRHRLDETRAWLETRRKNIQGSHPLSTQERQAGPATNPDFGLKTERQPKGP